MPVDKPKDADREAEKEFDSRYQFSGLFADRMRESHLNAWLAGCAWNASHNPASLSTPVSSDSRTDAQIAPRIDVVVADGRIGERGVSQATHDNPTPSDTSLAGQTITVSLEKMLRQLPKFYQGRGEDFVKLSEVLNALRVYESMRASLEVPDTFEGGIP